MIATCLTVTVLMVASVAVTPAAALLMRLLCQWLVDHAVAWAWEWLQHAAWTTLRDHWLGGIWGDAARLVDDAIPLSVANVTPAARSQVHTWGSVCTWTCFAIAKMSGLRRGAR